MDGLEISYRLRRAGQSQASLARELGVSSAVIGNVIHGRITAHGVATHIAKLLGLTVLDLWPERYRFKPRGASPHRRGHDPGVPP